MKKISRSQVLLFGMVVGILIGLALAIHYLVDSLNENSEKVSQLTKERKKTYFDDNKPQIDSLATLQVGDSKIDATIRRERAVKFIEAKKLDQALAECQTGLKDNPNEENLIMTQTRILLKMNRFQEALKSATLAIKHDPKSGLAYELRGIIFSKQRQMEKCREDFQRAYDIDPDYYVYIANLGEVEVMAGNYRKAIPLLNRAISSRPSGQLFFLRSIAYEHAGEKLQSQADRDQATSMGFKPDAETKQQPKLN